jgi:hypothetical protein
LNSLSRFRPRHHGVPSNAELAQALAELEAAEAKLKETAA